MWWGEAPDAKGQPEFLAVDHWLTEYARAWEERDPAAVVPLFTEDATYRSQPFREPHV